MNNNHPNRGRQAKIRRDAETTMRGCVGTCELTRDQCAAILDQLGRIPQLEIAARRATALEQMGKIPRRPVDPTQAEMYDAFEWLRAQGLENAHAARLAVRLADLESGK